MPRFDRRSTVKIKSVFSPHVQRHVPLLSSIVTVLVTLLTVFVLWLAWRSLTWPLVGDAAIMHFIVGQTMLGATPYRDVIDINMPLIYVIHAAIITVGGMGDSAFRIFDLGVSAIIGVLAAILVWRAGRGLALLAAVAIVLTHLMLGPLAAGQRDYILLIPMLSVAIFSIWLAEGTKCRVGLLLSIGILSAIAALLKPTAAFLCLTPLVTSRFQLRDIFWLLSGASAVAVAASAALLAMGGLAPFLET